MSGDTVRILLLEGVEKIEFGTTGNIAIFDSENNLVKAELNYPMEIRIDGTGFSINNKKINQSNLKFVAVKNSQPDSTENLISLLSVNGRKYRGEVRLINQNSVMQVINVLDLEEYLCGVVPREMPYNWQLEALKAQAVAARTYTLNCLEKRKEQNRIYDLKSTIADQVYGGYNDEKPTSNTAVNATNSEILVYNGKPILAVYHGNSGGALEDDTEVFRTNLPYLKGKPDKFAVISPNYIWSRKLTADELQTRLNKSEISLGKIDNVELSKIAESGRVREITFYYQNRKTILSGVTFRNLMGTTFIRSTLFTLDKQGDTYIFSGKGSGHGVGMSQCTAQNMAEQGINYLEILSYFYPGTNLVKINQQK